MRELSSLLVRLRRPKGASPFRLVRHYEGVLGTTLELQVLAASEPAARAAEAAALAEVERLERVYSRFLPESELNRWQASFGVDLAVSPELAGLLADSLRWIERSGGAFNPCADALAVLWREAEAAGVPPQPERLRSLALALREQPWSVDRARGTARRLTRQALNLNAIAKGRIVDLASAAAQAVEGVREVALSIGGDLRHRGSLGLPVRVEDPFDTADNAEPIARLTLCDAAMATSGRSRRGFSVGGRWYSHVLDPRDGQPAERVVAATVLAPDCASADAMATICSVLAPAESLRLAEDLPGVACLVVTADREQAASSRWPPSLQAPALPQARHQAFAPNA